MDPREPPVEGPPAESFASVFDVAETRHDGDRLVYVGEPRVGPDVLEREVWPLFREHGYEVRLTTVTESRADPITGLEIENTRHALVAEPRAVGLDGIPWLNVVTFLLTVLTTLLAGTMWYYEPVSDPLDLLAGWPFALAVMGVLGVHELGHYVLSRYHDVEASLPYFIPVPTFIGTLGAVIRMKGRIPDRRALFDIGVAGPLAGLLATVVVTVIGLYLPPIEVPQAVLDDPNAINIEFGFPPLLLLISELTGRPLSYADPSLAVNPVVFGGWIGMFVTFLNLIPVGQLDGGHLVRAMAGRRQETLAALVPLGLFGLSAYLYFVQQMDLRDSVLIWTFWGLISLGLARAGPATPIYDEPLDRKRMAVGVLTFVLGALCFTPVPFELLSV
ncbi:site-2 protease family protein [Salinirubellus sp. GCM10025818]|jgi:membrane-associated protease RseP (regulator of RpoE activity)|uniref:site-2 protease family protein n=1 Tax=Salinirubellus TaxID=2162630 RepID=UPI0030CB9B0E